MEAKRRASTKTATPNPSIRLLGQRISLLGLPEALRELRYNRAAMRGEEMSHVQVIHSSTAA